MDIFDSHYYKVNSFYLKLLGLWPFDNLIVRKTKRVFVIATIVSLMIPQTIRLYEEWNKDIDIVIEVVGSLIYFLGSLIKYASFLRVESKMMHLYKKIAEHWQRIQKEEEIGVLKAYGNAGRAMTVGYISLINIILFVYITVPLAPLFLDVIDPLNETRAKAFPYFAEYYVDDQKYYFELTLHGWVVFILSVQIYATFDTTYSQCVQHACALFAIVEQRIKAVSTLGTTRIFTSQQNKADEEYKSMRDAIIVHKETIEFVDDIESSYTFTFMTVLILNTVAVSLAAVVAMLSIEQGNLKHATRFVMLYVGFSFHLLFNIVPGQKVIDSSTNIGNAGYNCEWYNLSPKTKQLMRIMMLRSEIPCQFTAMKLITLNLENFGFVFRKSISYVTVVGSMR